MEAKIMSELAKAPIRRLVTNNGTVSISKEALDKIIEYTEEHLQDVGSELIDLTRHDGRKTILPRDVDLAFKKKCNC